MCQDYQQMWFVQDKMNKVRFSVLWSHHSFISHEIMVENS